MKLYYVTNIFDLQFFDNEPTTPLIFFENCTKIHLVSLFFRHERDITTSLLMILLKCTVVHYANLNSSSITKSFLNYRPSNMSLFLFFLFISYLYFFNKTFVKNVIKKLSFLNTNPQYSFQVVVCYMILECQTFRYKTKWLFEYKAKFEKNHLLFRPKISICESICL